MKELINYLNEIAEKITIANMINWEIDTKAPSKSYDYYINLSSKIRNEAFQMSTSETYINLINNAINSEEFNKLEDYKKLYFINLKNKYDREKKIPNDFFVEYIKSIENSKKVWIEAKKNNDYDLFKPHLEKLINITMELFRYMYGDVDNLYDKMINEYEKNVSSKDIDILFDKLKKEIIPIIKKLNNKNLKNIQINLSESELIELDKYLLDYIGFDTDRGTLGIFPHGYTSTLQKNDVRIAFNKTANIFDHMSTIIHEGGHGIFEQRFLNEFDELDLVDADNVALHESQSRFYENILGRNINFWIPIYDDIKKMTKLDLPIEEFIEYFNDAKPSLVRTEADELTYCLHIIIRYEIERDLFNGKINVADLPKIWNQKYKDYLGVEVKTDSEGIMQDLHWAEGNFGYFPTYLLGSIFDGMLLENITKKLGDIDNILKSGRIKEITKYLNENIHKYGGCYNIFETCERVCEKKLEVDETVKYFKKKYN